MMWLIFSGGYPNFLLREIFRLIVASPVITGWKCDGHFHNRSGFTNGKMVLKLNYCYRLKRMKPLKRWFCHSPRKRINAHPKAQI